LRFQFTDRTSATAIAAGTEKGRWGTGLSAEDMKKCVWVRPEIVAQIDYLEWTESDHLRHSKFIGLREDKSSRNVIKEHGGEV
jgi:ATP-dependent DNA ligase